MGTHATNYQSESIISTVLNFAFFFRFPKIYIYIFLAGGQKISFEGGEGVSGNELWKYARNG